MERKIGEIFEFGGEWYQCIVGNDCKNCAFNERKCYSIVENGDPIGECCGDRRKDSKYVLFKKLEKVGEPYFNGQYGEVLQEYKYYIPPITPDLRIHIIKLGIVGVEIKQNKKDMEENKTNWREADTPLTRLVGKYINNLIDYDTFEKGVKKLYSDKEENKPSLKEFDLEAAKSGKPVCTRNGCKARIICWDIKDKDNPIAAAVFVGECESVYLYTNKGEYNKGEEDELDLMMFSEKKEGWINVYENRVYSTKEEALDNKDPYAYCMTTIKVSWEE